MPSFNPSKLLAWLPVFVLACTVAGSAMVDNFRLTAHAEELKDVVEDIEDNEEAIEEIQRVLIRRQGEVQLKVQRIETEQQAQGDDISEILRLLKQQESNRAR